MKEAKGGRLRGSTPPLQRDCKKSPKCQTEFVFGGQHRKRKEENEEEDMEKDELEWRRRMRRNGAGEKEEEDAKEWKRGSSAMTTITYSGIDEEEKGGRGREQEGL
ncbi:hypothetical protein PoB_001413800 [Plakobranchus ocellatus]|uniref:Uncharacterized protein n=1 Tax=Plakobranchus ocellatus TaxID=259542 RepID=A0AAV3YYP3_9GAST|nr:hypothetical protein PoB_001413800 [Plakobranchus ocellatus]